MDVGVPNLESIERKKLAICTSRLLTKGRVCFPYTAEYQSQTDLPIHNDHPLT